MSFRDRLPLGSASFRGVPFNVEETEDGGGRRVVPHVFPKRDVPFYEDMGRQPREYRFDGFVVGADYDLGRDRLLEALEQAGPGELVHPFYGRVQVVVTGYAVRQSSRAMRQARFALAFAEAGAPRVPFSRTAPGAAVKTSAAVLEDAQEESFATKVVGAGVPSFVPMAAQTTWERFRQAIERADLSGAANAVDDLVAELGRTADRFIDLALTPRTLAGTLRRLLDSIDSAVASRVTLVRVYLGIETVRAPRLGGTSPLQVQAQRNADEVEALARAACIAGASRALADATFDTYDDAVELRDELLARIDELAGELSDEGFRSMQRLRSSVLEAVPGEDDDLPRLDVYTPPAVIPAVVIAWHLYADRSRDLEIVARNRIRHPGFVAAGPLQVRSS